jgi:hypothetical protein
MTDEFDRDGARTSSADRHVKLMEEVTLPEPTRQSALTTLMATVQGALTFDADEMRVAHALANRGYEWARESQLELHTTLPRDANDLLEKMIERKAEGDLEHALATMTSLILRSHGPFIVGREDDGETFEHIVARELNAAGVRTHSTNAPGMTDAFLLGAALCAGEKQVIVALDRHPRTNAMKRAHRWDWLPWRRGPKR